MTGHSRAWKMLPKLKCSPVLPVCIRRASLPSRQFRTKSPSSDRPSSCVAIPPLRSSNNFNGSNGGGRLKNVGKKQRETILIVGTIKLLQLFWFPKSLPYRNHWKSMPVYCSPRLHRSSPICAPHPVRFVCLSLCWVEQCVPCFWMIRKKSNWWDVRWILSIG